MNRDKPKLGGTVVIDPARAGADGPTSPIDPMQATSPAPITAPPVTGSAPRTTASAATAAPVTSPSHPTNERSHAESRAPSLAGKLLLGKYKLTRLLGEGGMGAVYEGEHVEIGKRVAVKLVHATFGQTSEIAERFKREARAASAVESDHIVQVFDVGVDPEVGLFMVMELLRGRDLASHLHVSGPMDPPIACGIALQAAAGLEAAHASGIVHRDLKPPNVFLVAKTDGSTHVKLVDFGVAKLVRDAQGGGVGLTRMGSALGTPQYMSPEQAQGLPTVDARSDIYALGAVLFESIAGVPAVPPLATYEQILIAIVTQELPRLASKASVPKALDDLVAEMMAKDPAKRPASMSVVLDRLLAIYPDLASKKLVVPGLEGEGGRLSRISSKAMEVPPTRTELAVDQTPVPSKPVPRGVALGAIGLFVLLAGAGLVVKLRPATTRTSASAPPPPSAPAPKASAASIAAPSAAPPPPVVPPASAPAAVAAASSSPPPVEKAKSARAQPGTVMPSKPAPTGVKVGGAGVSDQF